MNGLVLIAIGFALLVDIKLAGVVVVVIGAFRLLTWFPPGGR